MVAWVVRSRVGGLQRLIKEMSRVPDNERAADCVCCGGGVTCGEAAPALFERALWKALCSHLFSTLSQK